MRQVPLAEPAGAPGGEGRLEHVLQKLTLGGVKGAPGAGGKGIRTDLGSDASAVIP